MNKIEFFRGDSFDSTVEVKSNGAAVDLTDYTVTLTVKDSKGSTKMSKELLNENPETGVCVLSLSPEDNDIRPGTYKYDIQIKNTAGTKVHTIVRDQLIVKPDITI